LPGRDEGVIGRFKMPGVVPVEVSASRRQYEEDKADHGRKRVPPHKPAAACIRALRILLRTLFARGRHFHDPTLARVALWRRRRACAELTGVCGVPLKFIRRPSGGAALLPA